MATPVSQKDSISFPIVATTTLLQRRKKKYEHKRMDSLQKKLCARNTAWWNHKTLNESILQPRGDLNKSPASLMRQRVPVDQQGLSHIHHGSGEKSHPTNLPGEDSLEITRIKLTSSCSSRYLRRRVGVGV